MATQMNPAEMAARQPAPLGRRNRPPDLDTAFAEDDHPWAESHPRAALVVSILRRIAYTLLALFRSVTQRSEQRRAVPWKALMADCFIALVATTVADLARPKPNTC